MTPAWLSDTVTPDVSRALHYTALWGLEGVELRRVGHGTVPDVPNERMLRERLAGSEMAVVAVAPGLFERAVSDRAATFDDLARLDETLAFAGRVGCPVVVVGGFAREGFDLFDAVDALRRAADRAEASGARLAVLNTPESAVPTGVDLARLLDAVDRDAVGAAWHPANALVMDGVLGEGLAALGPRVRHVRVRDGFVDARGAWTDTLVGEGAVDWPAQMAHLRRVGYAGALSLEVHPVEGLAAPRVGLRSGTAVARMAR